MLIFADFVECALDVNLLDYQKEVLNKIHEKLERGEKLYYRPARGSSMTDYLAILIPMMYEGYETNIRKENKYEI